eukprot:751789-Hanusia_phi.AAC.3
MPRFIQAWKLLGQTVVRRQRAQGSGGPPYPLARSSRTAAEPAMSSGQNSWVAARVDLQHVKL